jgi:hypothetical protein
VYIEGVRRALLVLFVTLVCVPAAASKDGTAVLVIGPNGKALVEPFAPFTYVFENFDLVAKSLAPPTAPYVLVYPVMQEGIPMRPGRRYPRAGVLCSGWRTGIEAGCTTVPKLRNWFGSGLRTGLFRGVPTQLASLTRGGTRLLRYGNQATAIEMSLNQIGRAAPTPGGCVSFSARWTGPRASMQPTLFCVSPGGGVYADGKHYPLGQFGSAVRDRLTRSRVETVRTAATRSGVSPAHSYARVFAVDA